MSTERPILFSTEMVKAILAGKKTQTRRIIKPQPSEFVAKFTNNKLFEKNRWCPYAEVDKVLWVRERFRRVHHYGFDETLIQYADGTTDIPLADPDQCIPIGSWKPSIHMPRVACRLLLKVKSVRMERLHEISQADAIAEGIQMTWINDDPAECRFKNYINDGTGSLMPCQSYRSLWKSINGADSWNLNPWVWVIEFQKIERP